MTQYATGQQRINAVILTASVDIASGKKEGPTARNETEYTDGDEYELDPLFHTNNI